MENLKDPIDEQIVNNDDAVTNKDGDNMLEQEEDTNVQTKPDEVRGPTVTPGDDTADAAPEDSKDQDEDAGNKGEGPKGQNL